MRDFSQDSGFILETENEGGISPLHLQNRGGGWIFKILGGGGGGGGVWNMKTLPTAFVPINAILRNLLC